MKETTDGELLVENASTGDSEGLECNEELDIEEFSWDGLLIEDDDDEAMYF